jgi:hypothetical protein
MGAGRAAARKSRRISRMGRFRDGTDCFAKTFPFPEVCARFRLVREGLMVKLVGVRGEPAEADGGFVRVRGAREHNLKDVSLDIPRNSLVVFTGVSGSGKSSLAFGTLYAEAQRRYLESVSPYARRLFHQMAVPEVDSVEGLPPAVALQQQRGSPTTRSSVGSVTTLSDLLRMLYSRAGDYPRRQPLLYAESFSPNTPEGACPNCHGIGRVHEVSERSLVPDDSLTIRERAIAAWPTAWQGQNLRDMRYCDGDHDGDEGDDAPSNSQVGGVRSSDRLSLREKRPRLGRDRDLLGRAAVMGTAQRLNAHE